VAVVPAYGEAATIAAVVAGALRVADRVVVVDDGSADGTGEIAAAAGALVLRNPTNLGKGESLRRGLARALELGAAEVVTLDGDGQHRPEDVPRLAARAAERPGRIVIGSRRAGGSGAPRSRYVANRVADFWVSWAAGGRVDDTQSGLRLYPADALRRLDLDRRRAGGFAFESEVLIDAGRLGIRTASVPIEALYEGVLRRPSHFRPVADIPRIVRMVAGKLLRRWMDPVGLWRSLRGEADGTLRGERAPDDAVEQASR
jgi:glycosyltransferase involved in cell wall biosynthesis